MGDLSVAVIVGRLTRDAELKYIPSGQAICKFSVATSTRVKKGDQWIDESSYWNVDLWGKRAEAVSQYLIKGKLVAVQGDMRQDKWEKDGQAQMKVLITANDVQLLGSGGASGGGQAEGQGGSGEHTPTRGSPPAQGGRFGQGGAPGAAPSRGPQGPAHGGDDFTDDIPF